MRVLYVCADRGIPVLGNKGASVHVRSLTGAIHSVGHQVTLVARRWGKGNEPPAAARLERLAKDDDTAADQLEQLIRELSIDVVIERYSLQSGAARAATARCGLPLTLEVNAPLVQEAMRFRGLDDPHAEEREHATLRGADRIQVVSSALGRYVRAVAPEVPVALIPNGADVRRFQAAAPAKLPTIRGRTLVGFVGSMKPWHGVEQLLEAFARVHRTHAGAALAYIGSGPLETQLNERVAQLDLQDSVVFTGPVLHADVPSLVARLDIGVAPYIPLDEFYFHPLKVVEYLAAGKPVIYSDQGDMATLVGPAGLGHEPGSVGELARDLAQLLGDPALRRSLAARAAARGAEFDWTVTAERVLRFASGASDQSSAGRSASMPSVGVGSA
jgi:glycosyltransferase involved in cell wall biosynthesis